MYRGRHPNSELGIYFWTPRDLGRHLKLPVVGLLRTYTPRLAMSRLSNSLKALINAPAARPSTVPAPANIVSAYGSIQQTAQAQNVSRSSWLALSVSTYWGILARLNC